MSGNAGTVGIMHHVACEDYIYITQTNNSDAKIKNDIKYTENKILK